MIRAEPDYFRRGLGKTYCEQGLSFLAQAAGRQVIYCQRFVTSEMQLLLNTS